jgi:hypothetical protein
MSNPIHLGNVIGTDAVSPIISPDGLFKIWNKEDIFFGTIGTKKYIPNIQDVVYEFTGTTIEEWIVMDVNNFTGIPVLARRSTGTAGVFTEKDILIGMDPGQPTSTFLAYYDDSVIPYRLNVDARLVVNGSMCKSCKLFKGSLLTNSAEVVSRMYDTAGNLLGEDIPLELVATRILDNTAVKSVRPAYTTSRLANGELLTAVFYNDEGFVISKRQVMVHHTSFIRAPDTSTRYITGIDIRSPFLSRLEANKIEYPINVPINGLNMIGVVHYSNGDTAEYPVDGTRFKVMGFEDYVATESGQNFEVVVSYSLMANEVNYIAVVGGDRHIAKRYSVTTLPSDGMYGVKLYVYPVWVDAASGYKLDWFMYNLNRDVAYNVTQYVGVNTTRAAFQPNLYGVQQTLSVSINLHNVSGAFRNYTHTQVVDIILERQGTERLTNWKVGTVPGQSPMYGINTYAKARFVSTATYSLDITAGETDLTVWLDKIYAPTKPLINPETEYNPPKPTHFTLVNKGKETTYPIAQWNKPLVLGQVVDDFSTLYVKFSKQVGDHDLQLSIAGMPVYYVNAAGAVIT